MSDESGEEDRRRRYERLYFERFGVLPPDDLSPQDPQAVLDAMQESLRSTGGIGEPKVPLEDLLAAGQAARDEVIADRARQPWWKGPPGPEESHPPLPEGMSASGEDLIMRRTPYRPTPGGSGMSFGEGAAAAQAALTYTRDELGAAVHLVLLDADQAQAQYAMAWGSLVSGHLDAIQQQLMGIAEKAFEMVRALAIIEQVTQEYIALLSSGPQ